MIKNGYPNVKTISFLFPDISPLRSAPSHPSTLHSRLAFYHVAVILMQHYPYHLVLCLLALFALCFLKFVCKYSHILYKFIRSYMHVFAHRIVVVVVFFALKWNANAKVRQRQWVNGKVEKWKFRSSEVLMWILNSFEFYHSTIYFSSPLTFGDNNDRCTDYSLVFTTISFAMANTIYFVFSRKYFFWFMNSLSYLCSVLNINNI